jgi:hypothetical protein
MSNRWREGRPVPENGPCDDVIALLQDGLDGVLPWEQAEARSLSHRQSCSLCRERWAAARLLLKVLQGSPVDSSRPSRATSVTLIVSQVRVDQRRQRIRRGLITAALGSAAALFVAVTLWNPLNPAASDTPTSTVGVREAESQPLARLTPQSAVVPPSAAPLPTTPLRLNATLAQAADTVLESVSDWAEPSWPRWPDNLLATPQPESPPWGGLLLSSVRTGLEPVKDTTQKALDCFLRDLATWQPPSPKS